MKDLLRNLRSREYYSVYEAAEKPFVVYESHRFILPILIFAKKSGLLPEPLNMVYFDRHPDALEPPNLARKVEQLEKLADFTDIFDYVEKEISYCNDDWLKLLMNLEIVNDAVLIGGEGHLPMIFDSKYVDLDNKVHWIKRVPALVDFFKSRKIMNDDILHSILGISYDNKVLKFKSKPPLLLDFDLDYFTCLRDRHIYSWHDELYQIEFEEKHKDNWTGLKLLEKLLSRSQFVTIAKETMFCGGEKDMQYIWLTLRDYFKTALKTSQFKQLTRIYT